MAPTMRKLWMLDRLWLSSSNSKTKKNKKTCPKDPEEATEIILKSLIVGVMARGSSRRRVVRVWVLRIFSLVLITQSHNQATPKINSLPPLTPKMPKNCKISEEWTSQRTHQGQGRIRIARYIRVTRFFRLMGVIVA